ncbi:hypothetical protein AAE478_006322 [Parahypoxylon ruwenzoriense]
MSIQQGDRTARRAQEPYGLRKHRHDSQTNNTLASQEELCTSYAGTRTSFESEDLLLSLESGTLNPYNREFRHGQVAGLDSRMAASTPACDGKHCTCGYGHTAQGQAQDTFLNRATSQTPTLTSHCLRQQEAQQKALGHFALETWRAESLYDGPLRVIPEFTGPGDWDWRADGDDQARLSDTRATGARTPDEGPN